MNKDLDMQKIQYELYTICKRLGLDFQGEVFMTITQLANALEYASKSAIEKMVQRNEYLKDTEFSATDILSAPDGKNMKRAFLPKMVFMK